MGSWGLRGFGEESGWTRLVRKANARARRKVWRRGGWAGRRDARSRRCRGSRIVAVRLSMMTFSLSCQSDAGGEVMRAERASSTATMTE